MLSLDDIAQALHDRGTRFCGTFSSRSSDTLLSFPVGVLEKDSCERKHNLAAMNRIAPDVQSLALVKEHEGARVVEIISEIILH